MRAGAAEDMEPSAASRHGRGSGICRVAGGRRPMTGTWVMSRGWNVTRPDGWTGTRRWWGSPRSRSGCRWTAGRARPVARAGLLRPARGGSALVVDCRPADRRGPRDLAAFEVTRRACDLVGWEYRLVGAPDPVATANLRWLSGYRHPRHDIPERGCGAAGRVCAPAPLMDGAERWVTRSPCCPCCSTCCGARSWQRTCRCRCTRPRSSPRGSGVTAGPVAGGAAPGRLGELRRRRAPGPRCRRHVGAAARAGPVLSRWCWPPT